MLSRWLKPSAWVLYPIPSSFAPSSKWSNADMDPVPPALRTWATWNWITYWITASMSIPGWETASSMMKVGLSWQEALAAIAVSHILVSWIIVLNGTMGARLHIPFPVAVRASFGFYFAYFAIVSRVVLSKFWYGIQCYTGGECVYQMLKAIWPSIANMPNHLPASAGMTSSSMMTYFLFWLIQLPLMMISPHRLRWLFLVKSIIIPIATLILLIWAVVRVPTSESLGNSAPSTLSGSAKSYAILAAINSGIGSWITLGCNIPDFSRYSKTPRSQLVQLLVIPAGFTWIGFIGIVVTATGEKLYGETIWDPMKFLDRWDNRAAVFFLALSFTLATIGTNISGNSLSAANDLVALCPKYINIRRGQVICAIIGGWALCPWEIEASAPGFLAFMSGYTIFLGPFCAIMIADYWLVNRGRVDVPAMYNRDGIYHYWHGINPRAAAALLLTIPPALPGLASAINTNIHVGNALHLYQMNAFFGFFAGGFVYWVLSALFPNKETKLKKGVFPDETDTNSIEDSRGLDKDAKVTKEDELSDDKV